MVERLEGDCYDDLKKGFLTVCAEWADLLVGDGIETKQWQNERPSDDPEKFIPKVAYGDATKERSVTRKLLGVIDDILDMTRPTSPEWPEGPVAYAFRDC